MQRCQILEESSTKQALCQSPTFKTQRNNFNIFNYLFIILPGVSHCQPRIVQSIFEPSNKTVNNNIIINECFVCFCQIAFFCPDSVFLPELLIICLGGSAKISPKLHIHTSHSSHKRVSLPRVRQAGAQIRSSNPCDKLAACYDMLTYAYIC